MKKGAIESYYYDNNEITDKVENAVSESENISSLSEETIKNSYRDILNCLKYASNSENIDESRAIRDELLSFIAPIHARYAEGETNLENLNRPSSIFSYRINENEKLEISMDSKVLDVRGFPITLEKDGDVRKIINHCLGLK